MATWKGGEQLRHAIRITLSAGFAAVLSYACFSWCMSTLWTLAAVVPTVVLVQVAIDMVLDRANMKE